MSKQIIILLVTVLSFFSCNIQDHIVLLKDGECISDTNGNCIIYDSNGNKLGVISKPNDLPDCDDYYLLTPYRLFGKWYYIRERIPLFGTYPKRHFIGVVGNSSIDTTDNELKFKLQAGAGSNYNFKAIYYTDTTQKTIVRIESQHDASSYQEIAENDYSYYPSSRICDKDTIIAITDTMNLYDYLIGWENIKVDNCFDCPIRYTLKECENMKKNNIPFVWKDDD